MYAQVVEFDILKGALSLILDTPTPHTPQKEKKVAKSDGSWGRVCRMVDGLGITPSGAWGPWAASSNDWFYGALEPYPIKVGGWRIWCQGIRV